MELIWDFQKFMEENFDKPHNIYENVGVAFDKTRSIFFHDLYSSWEDALNVMTEPMQVLVERKVGSEETNNLQCEVIATIQPNKFLFPKKDYSQTGTANYHTDLSFEILAPREMLMIL